jgi:hypothetical protein
VVAGLGRVAELLVRLAEQPLPAGGPVFEWLYSVTPERLLVGALFVMAWPAGRALVVWVQGQADVARIKARGEVLMNLAMLEPEQAERLQARLDRVRPPPPDQLQPPAAS